MRNEFVRFFSNLFSPSNPIFPYNMDDLIYASISDIDNEVLCHIPNCAKIKENCIYDELI